MFLKPALTIAYHENKNFIIPYMRENENFNAGEFARFQEFLGFLLKQRVYSLVLRKYDIDLHYYDIGVYFLWLLYIYRIKETQEGRDYEQGKELYKCGNW